MRNRIILAIVLALFSTNALALDLWRAKGSPAFLDTNGDPLAGKLCFFDAGTTNERTVYKDSGSVTPWAQPIAIDSAGRLTDGIYIPTGAFKEVLRSADATTCSDGTAVYTFDNIPGAFDTTTINVDFAKPEQPVLSKASNYTVVTADLGSVINVSATGGAVTITLPSASTAGNGGQIAVRKVDSSANVVTVSVTGAQTIDGASSQALSTQYDRLIIQSDGANWYTLGGVPAGTVTFAKLATTTYSTDGTLAGNSDVKLPTQKAVKTYADTLFAAGISWLTPAHVATTANLATATDLENGDTVDGQVLVTGERVLVKNQSTASQNGIYVTSASGAASRATDIDQAAEFAGATVFVETGTANEGTQWTQTQTVATVGTDSVAWVLIASGITYTADGSTLSLTGTQFSVASSGITATQLATNSVGADELQADSVGASEIIASAVGTSEIADGAVATADIADDAVTYAKVQNVTVTDVFLGRDTAGAGAIEEIARTAAFTILCGADPNADRFAFWDDSAGTCAYLTPGNGLTITTTTVAVDTASTTVDGIMEQADQTEMEAASSTSVAVVPGRVQNHPGVAKAWGYVTYSGGTPTLITDYGVTSISDGGQGILGITLDTAMSSTSYAVIASANKVPAEDITIAYPSINSTTSITITFRNATSTADPSSVHFVVYGDQ